MNHEEELSEEEAMERVLKYHPDLERLYRKGKLPDEMTDGQGNVWSPRAHLELHVVIERQLASDNPPGIVSLAGRLEQENKLSPHDVRHVLAAAVSEQLWSMQIKQHPFDRERYFLDIERQYQRWVKARDH